MKKNNNKGFGIIIAIGMVVLMGLLASLIFEYMIPVARNVKGMENVSKAYYKANLGIEEALWFISQNPIGSSTGTIYNGDHLDHKFEVIASGSIIPPVGEGNSEYDDDWNKLSEGNPIQLEIGYNYIDSFLPNTIGFDFRIPDLDLDSLADEQLSGPINTELIHWQLTSETDALNADGSLITIGDISGGLLEFKSNVGITLGATGQTIQEFYVENCGVGLSCKLKLSIIDRLTTTDGGTSPYLEWKGDFEDNVIPLRYARIYSDGKSFGYKKDLDISIPQQTVIEAFDFTVFQ